MVQTKQSPTKQIEFLGWQPNSDHHSLGKNKRHLKKNIIYFINLLLNVGGNSQSYLPKKTCFRFHVSFSFSSTFGSTIDKRNPTLRWTQRSSDFFPQNCFTSINFLLIKVHWIAMLVRWKIKIHRFGWLGTQLPINYTLNMLKHILTISYNTVFFQFPISHALALASRLKASSSSSAKHQAWSNVGC